MSSTNIFTKTCNTSAYGFACGYVERDFNEHYTVEMYMEHNHYHVRVIPQDQKPLVWDTFTDEDISKARGAFKRYAGKYLAPALPFPTFTQCNPLDQLTKQLNKYINAKA